MLSILMDDILKTLTNKAKKYGASEFGLSRTKNKRFYVIYNNRRIHFGSKEGKTYIDHRDKSKRTAWRSRHIRILKDGYPAYTNKMSPEFWNWNLTW